MALVFAFAGPARAQTGGGPEFVGALEESFVLFQNDRGETVCRVATPEEHERIRAAAATRVIYRGAPTRRKVTQYGYEVVEPNAAEDTSGVPLLPSAGLTIVLQGTAQLDANPAAKAAFIAAANRWESVIATPITVTLSVDFGPQFFGKDYGSTSILGQTGSFVIKNQEGNDPTFAAIRDRLINSSNATPAELALYHALPADSVPAEFNGSTVNVSSVRVNTAQARAIGFNVNPPADAQIGFNSNFGPTGNPGQFDFDPSDGIAAGYTDFDAVVVHEIGHALGFTSANGGTGSSALSIWDLFRFRPGAASAGSFGSAPRVLTAGDAQVMFGGFASTYGSQELALSTGGPSGSAGDGRQSSHWKDDQLFSTRPFIGIMDPTLSRGLRRTITENDIRAIDLIGYSVAFDPARPPNDNFADATPVGGASGTVTGASAWATREPGEPGAQAGYTGDKSVWFAWTAPTTGTASFDTYGSGFDTTLGVYTGAAVGALTSPPCVVCQNDNANSGINISRINFNTVAGAVYYLNVDGWNGESGPVQLNWTSTVATPTPTPTPVVSYSISGRVVDAAGNGLGGVSVAIDGPNLVNTFPHMPVTTDGNGGFQFSLLTPGGNYTVRSNDARYAFTPAAVFNNISANHTVTLTATPLLVPVTGRVVEGGQGLAGALVGLYDNNNGALLQQTSTGADGRWTFAGVGVGRGYTLSFVKSGYTLSPNGFPVQVGASALDVGDVTAVKANRIEETEFFVAQHYRDFLGREADASGLSFWTNEIEGCGVDTACREVKRINVSAAFFQSIEFQQTGYLAYRMYKAAYGDRTESSTGLSVPAITREEFMQDAPLVSAGVVVGVGDWALKLENNKAAYAQAFVQRQRFADVYGALAAAQFVERLDQNAGGVLTADERAALAGELAANDTAAARASVLRRVAEHPELDRREKNRAFVLMQYFGYLRRNPSDAPERDLNYSGWNYWLGKLNDFNGNFVAAEMVKAFLDSTEYRQRFAGQ